MKNPKSFLFLPLVIVALCALLLSPPASGNSTAPGPRAAADITIKTDGLLACAFGDPAQVSIGILDVHAHQPTITINKVTGQKRTTIATIGAAELCGQTVSFDLEGGQTGAISRYLSPDQSKDLADFRWTLDLENDLLHRDLELRADRFFAKLRINTGGQWLADVDGFTDHAVQFISEDGKTLPFKRKFAAPEMRLNLDRGQALVISGKRNIRLVPENGARYEISITNVPAPGAGSIEHFMHYWDVIAEKNKPTVYKPVMLQTVSYSPKPLLCGPILFGRSRIN